MHSLLFYVHFSPKYTASLILNVVDFCQGLPIGLVFGTIPFLLKSSADASQSSAYGKIGLFSLATYPYSFKLLWSPIVDSCYSSRIGRRKSWIIPIQMLVGLFLIGISFVLPGLLQTTPMPARLITFIFFMLNLLCSVQDIAVDGWALTLLDQNHVQFASTCQAIGLNSGYFLSFTVFLALNSPSFWY